MPRWERNSIAHAIEITGLSQRTVAARTGLSQSMISRASQTPWNELEYEKVKSILAGIYDETYPGRYEINKNANGTVASVYFITA